MSLFAQMQTLISEGLIGSTTKADKADGLSAARSSLREFIAHVKPDFQFNWHHELLIAELEQVRSGDLKRMKVHMPPQHGKSTVVQYFCAFMFGDNPDIRIVLGSYNMKLARKASRAVKAIMGSSAYRQLFPKSKLGGAASKDTANTADYFEIEGHRGYFMSAGVDSSLTGYSYDVGIIDDPVKSRAEAESEVYRENTHDWYKSTFYTRKSGDAAILVIQTRWHLDDLSGRLELVDEGEGAEGWRTISLPAIAEEPIADYDPRKVGEALWADRYDLNNLKKTETTVGIYEFSALYQQSPQPSSGGMFKREKFNLIKELPADILRVVRFWDLALSSKTMADYTVGVMMGITASGRIVIMDMQRFQKEWDDVEPLIASRAVIDLKDVQVGIEQTFYASRAVTKLLKRPELHQHTIRGIKPDADKVTRARPFEARVGAGLVDVVQSGWTGALLDELCAFPMGKHDDIVDACSGAYTMLDTHIETKVYSDNVLFDY